jgi:Flp pilus assembly protein TadB
MNALVALALGAGIGVGVLLVGAGVRGSQVLPAVSAPRNVGRSPRWLLALATAVLAGFVALAVTGWPVAGVITAVAVVLAPRLLSTGNEHRREIALVEAIASWAEMVRDTIAAAAGLEQAIAATGTIAPAALAGAVARLAQRMQFEPLPVALRQFADEVDHPTCDFVVAALVIAAEKEARDLGPLLGQLADCARDEAKMHTRVWVDRAKTRTSVRVIAACVVAFAAGLLLFSRRYLEPYDTVGGQLMLLVIAGLFAGSLVGMQRLGRVALPERFVARRS